MNETRFQKQLDFIFEIDKVKNILRKTKLFDGCRFENDAEHSWTICLMAILFKEYSNKEIDLQKVITMLLIHDIVEIDAGDVLLYSAKRDGILDAEEKAAQRIFGILEDDQKSYFYNLWREFEEKKTPEAQFASVFDRIEPILQNYKNEGFAWKQHNIKKHQVIERNIHIRHGSEEIWNFILKLLDVCVEKGYLTE